MSEFPQNRLCCFSVAEEVAAAAQRFCLRKDAHEEEMHVDDDDVVVDDVGPRTDARARSTIALLMRVILCFVSRECLECVAHKVLSKKCVCEEKKTQKYELLFRKKKKNF